MSISKFNAEGYYDPTPYEGSGLNGKPGKRLTDRWCLSAAHMLETLNAMSVRLRGTAALQ